MLQGCQKHRRTYRACSWNPGQLRSIGSVLRGFYFPDSGVEKITSAHQHQENSEICSSISSWIIEECGGDRGMQRSKQVCSFFITEFKPGHSPIRQEPAGPSQYCALPAGLETAEPTTPTTWDFY